MDKKTTLDVKLENDEFVTETDSEDEENDNVQIRNFNEESDGRFLFIYQSNDMKRIYRKYAPYLILLDATYRTTKYTQPLYYSVVKINVNYQIRPYFSLISLYINCCNRPSANSFNFEVQTYRRFKKGKVKKVQEIKRSLKLFKKINC